MKNLIIILIIAGITLALGNIGHITQAAYVDPFNTVCDSTTTAATVCQDSQKSQDASGSNSIYGSDGILMTATRIVGLVVGIASVIIIILGGIKYITSQGDANSTNNARNTILYALIGLVIAFSAQFIISFVISRLE